MPSTQSIQQDAANQQIEALVPNVIIDHLRLGASKLLAGFRNITIVYFNFVDLYFWDAFVDTLQAAVLKTRY